MIGQLTIVGGRGSKGEYEGTAFDKTTLNVLVPYSRSNKNAFGLDAIPARFGKEENAAPFKEGKHYPLVVECDYEMVAAGGGVQIEIYEVIKFINVPNAVSQANK